MCGTDVPSNIKCPPTRAFNLRVFSSISPFPGGGCLELFNFAVCHPRRQSYPRSSVYLTRVGRHVTEKRASLPTPSHPRKYAIIHACMHTCALPLERVKEERAEGGIVSIRKGYLIDFFCFIEIMSPIGVCVSARARALNYVTV